MTRTGRKASGAGTPSRTHVQKARAAMAGPPPRPRPQPLPWPLRLEPYYPPQRNSLRKVVGRLAVTLKEWALEGACEELARNCEELALEGALEAQAQQNAFRGAGTGACTGLE